MKRMLYMLGVAGLLWAVLVMPDHQNDPTAVSEAAVRSCIHGDLELASPYGEIARFYDDHGGFHGDGETFIECHPDSHQMAEEIAQHPSWQPMPVSREVRILVYGMITKQSDNSVTLEGPTIVSRDGDSWIPEIEHGFWMLVDRQPESYRHGRRNVDEPEGILNRYSFNLTIGLYDSDQNILYVLALDT